MNNSLLENKLQIIYNKPKNNATTVLQNVINNSNKTKYFTLIFLIIFN